MTGDGAPCDAMTGDGQSPELNVTAQCSSPALEAPCARSALCSTPCARSARSAALCSKRRRCVWQYRRQPAALAAQPHPAPDCGPPRLGPHPIRADPAPRRPCAFLTRPRGWARLSRHRLWSGGLRRVAVSASRRQGWFGDDSAKCATRADGPSSARGGFQGGRQPMVLRGELTSLP